MAKVVITLTVHGSAEPGSAVYGGPMDTGAWQATGPWGCKESDMTEQGDFLSRF